MALKKYAHLLWCLYPLSYRLSKEGFMGGREDHLIPREELGKQVVCVEYVSRIMLLS